VTGSRGIHVMVPLDRSARTVEVAAFADGVAQLLVQRHPDELTVEGRKESREGRLYVDVARNAWAQTSVAPYSVRPRRGAPVATPITWEELDDGPVRADQWSIRTIPDRLATRGDPWHGMWRHARSLVARRERLDSLLE
jgi:bifunctional non-homologous end joining protein LigD